MTRRAAIEQVLRKHRVLYPGVGKTGGYWAKQHASDDVLLDDLLACWPEPSCANCGKNPPTYCYACWEGETRRPEPSREALTRLLTAFANYIRRRRTELVVSKEWEPEFLAWALGQPTQPAWCLHLVWHRESWWLTPLAGAPRFIWPDDECPICAAPRTT